MSESIFNQIGSVVKNALDLKVSHTDVSLNNHSFL